jgi:hypothetical protein
MALLLGIATRYIVRMVASPVTRVVLKVSLGVAVFAAATGAAFAAWMDNHADIFRAMVESGLAWCM